MSEPRDLAAPQSLTTLVYELLDAHADTADLAGELVDDPRWAAHLDYLRVLQRKGREALSRGGADLSRSRRPPVGEEVDGERQRPER